MFLSKGSVILVLLAWFPAVYSQCDNIAQTLNNCVQAPSVAVTTTTTADYLSTYCNNLECNLKCMVDAVGDCYLQDQFFSLSPTVLKVTTRMFCDKSAAMVSGLLHCLPTDASCVSGFANTILTAVNSYNANDFAAYKTTICGAYSTYLGCLPTTASGDCTQEGLDLIRFLYQLYIEYTSCGTAPTSSSYVTMYGQDITAACSASTLFRNVFLVIMSTAVHVLYG